MKAWIGLAAIVVLIVIISVMIVVDDPAPGKAGAAREATAESVDAMRVQSARIGPDSDPSAPASEVPRPAELLPTPTNAEPVVFSSEEARAYMHQRQRERDCALAREANQPEKMTEREEMEWQWLPAESAAAERAAFAESSRRMLDGCRDEPADSEQQRILDSRRASELAAAIRAGVLQARIEALDVPRGAGPDYPDELYPLARDVFASKDPEAIHRLGRLSERYGQGMGWRHIPDPELVWSLVACDLGRECGAGSRALDQDCLSHGNCGYPDLESALRDRVSPQQFERAQMLRRGIVDHYRAGALERFMQRDPRMRDPGG